MVRLVHVHRSRLSPVTPTGSPPPLCQFIHFKWPLRQYRELVINFSISAAPQKARRTPGKCMIMSDWTGGVPRFSSLHALRLSYSHGGHLTVWWCVIWIQISWPQCSSALALPLPGTVIWLMNTQVITRSSPSPVQQGGKCVGRASFGATR